MGNGRYSAFRKEMERAAAAWFSARGRPVSRGCDYILDSRDAWRHNIILLEVADLIDATLNQSERFPLHKYVHHGLSSQALLFNLVGPLVARDDLMAAGHAFERIGAPWPEADVRGEFEFDDRKTFNEQQTQPTSIDFVVRGDGGMPLFIECKFVEQEFGGCTLFKNGDCDGMNPCKSLDDCYLHRIGRKYWGLMGEHGLLDGPSIAGPLCPMANFYQFYREVLFALAHDGVFVLIHDERNPTFYREENGSVRGLFPFLSTLLPTGVRGRLFRVSIQQVAAAIESSGRHSDWIGDFRLKYGIR